ncbi:MAG: sulfotransferase [Flavobacteriales bacterium]
MSHDRTSASVKAGRILQKGVWTLRPLDTLLTPFFPRKGKEDPYGLLVLLAPPRSGSTLTYQLLRSGIRGTYLSNLQNLLYANPLLGQFLQGPKCGNSISAFRSSGGFVPGICGESEGLRFWKYWLGQGLEEQDELIPPQRARGLERAVRKINTKRAGPFITGFLGHVFSIDALQQIFPKVRFIHLKRDLLSNAASLYRYAPDRWRSTRPMGYGELLEHTREEQVVEHILRTHRTILRKRKENPDAFVEVGYEKLCRDPVETLRNIGADLEEKGIPLALKQLDTLPSHFEERKASPDDPANKGLREAIEKRVGELNEDEKHFFRSILSKSHPEDHHDKSNL